MNLATIYITGVIVAFLLGCRLYYKEKSEDKEEIGIIAVLAITSWIAVILILLRLRNKL